MIRDIVLHFARRSGSRRLGNLNAHFHYPRHVEAQSLAGPGIECLGEVGTVYEANVGHWPN